MARHRTDASALLDNRGYSGPLTRGQNPATLIETGVRDRITESYYWKEQCFALNEATICDRAVEVGYFGGTYGDVGKPTPFLCLLFKLLQLQPSRDVVLEYLNFVGDDGDKNDDDRDDDTDRMEDVDEPAKPDTLSKTLSHRKGSFKYLRALAAFYIRLAWEPVDIYTTLEPLLLDYRKLKRRTRTGFTLSYIDSFVDDLLNKDRVCGTALWKLPSRLVLEELDKLEPRESPLADELESGSDEEEDGGGNAAADRRSRQSISPSRSPSPVRKARTTQPPASIAGPRPPPKDQPSLPTGTKPTTSDTNPSGPPKPKSIANEEATKQARSYGPSKASSNVRYTHYTDFAPDICKDYRQTGFCGFGDSCKFLHIREEYKQGWALDRDWEINEKSKKKVEGNDGAGDEGNDGEKDKKNADDGTVADDGTPLVDGIRTKCFICKSDYRDPVVTKCGHYFCERCVLARKSAKCAVCSVETGGMFTVVSKQTKRKLAAALEQNR